MPLHELPEASFTTQRRALHKPEPDAEPVDLISVFLAPGEPSSGGVVTESDRGQVLDAIIDYGGELLVVLENKIADVSADEPTQALLLNTTGAHVVIVKT